MSSSELPDEIQVAIAAAIGAVFMALALTVLWFAGAIQVPEIPDRFKTNVEVTDSRHCGNTDPDCLD